MTTTYLDRLKNHIEHYGKGKWKRECEQTKEELKALLKQALQIREIMSASDYEILAMLHEMRLVYTIRNKIREIYAHYKNYHQGLRDIAENLPDTVKETARESVQDKA